MLIIFYCTLYPKDISYHRLPITNLPTAFCQLFPRGGDGAAQGRKGAAAQREDEELTQRDTEMTQRGTERSRGRLGEGEKGRWGEFKTVKLRDNSVELRGKKRFRVSSFGFRVGGIWII